MERISFNKVCGFVPCMARIFGNNKILHKSSFRIVLEKNNYNIWMVQFEIVIETLATCVRFWARIAKPKSSCSQKNHV